MEVPNIIKNLFTGGASKLIDSVKGAISEFHLSPEDKLKAEQAMAEIINKHVEAMQVEATKQMEIQAKENESARNREIQIATSEKAPLLNKIVTPLLALIIVLGTMVLWYLILFRHYEPKTNEAMVIGALTTMSSGVLSYYFGSSIGSKEKQATIDRMK